MNAASNSALNTMGGEISTDKSHPDAAPDPGQIQAALAACHYCQYMPRYSGHVLGQLDNEHAAHAAEVPRPGRRSQAVTNLIQHHTVTSSLDFFFQNLLCYAMLCYAHRQQPKYHGVAGSCMQYLHSYHTVRDIMPSPTLHAYSPHMEK